MPTPSAPQASSTARRDNRQPGALAGPPALPAGPRALPAGPRAVLAGHGRCSGARLRPVPAQSPTQSALDLSTHRSSPVPARSPLSLDRSAKYSASPGS